METEYEIFQKFKSNFPLKEKIIDELFDMDESVKHMYY